MINCMGCKLELDSTTNGVWESAHYVIFYGGDPDKDGYYCSRCAVDTLERELADRHEEVLRAMDLAEDNAAINNREGK